MKNININHFVRWSFILDHKLQYAIIKKEFSPDACRCRMINNIGEDEDNFVTRIVDVLRGCSIEFGEKALFTWDRDLGTNVFLFKVGVLGYVMLACDDMAIVKSIFETAGEVDKLKSELIKLRKELIELLSKR